jgi:hypothetical protein
MRNYRTTDETTFNDQSTTMTKAAIQVDPWQYHIADYEADVDADTSITEQTTEEEFTAYIMSLPKQKAALDTVKFWEVCLSSLSESLSFHTGRPITLHSQQFTAWPWIICRFKLLQFLVNEFFLLVLRLTQVNATELNPSYSKLFKF